MKNEENVRFICKKLKCSREEVLGLSDNTFVQVLNLISNREVPLTIRESDTMRKLAKKISEIE